MTVARPSRTSIFSGRAEWRAWLEDHGADETELWLALYKKGSGKAGVTYEEAVEEALCFGWIDGQVQAIDEDKFAVRFSPRKPGSVWSESNKRRVEKLVGEGRMTEAGLRLVEAARTRGAWEDAARREALVLSPELAQALSAREGALAAFEALPPSRKKQMLWWVADAKREPTRQKRLEAVVEETLRRGGGARS